MKQKITLVCGATQVSNLGPILFLMFLMILIDSLNFSKSIQSADDTVIYYYRKSVTNIEEMLNRNLSSLSKCLIYNKLIINLDNNKIEAVIWNCKTPTVKPGTTWIILWPNQNKHHRNMYIKEGH